MFASVICELRRTLSVRTIASTLVSADLRPCQGLNRMHAVPLYDTFRAVILSAMFGILFVYLATALFGMFGVRIPFLHELMGNGVAGIVFSVM